MVQAIGIELNVINHSFWLLKDLAETEQLISYLCDCANGVTAVNAKI